MVFIIILFNSINEKIQHERNPVPWWKSVCTTHTHAIYKKKRVLCSAHAHFCVYIRIIWVVDMFFFFVFSSNIRTVSLSLLSLKSISNASWHSYVLWRRAHTDIRNICVACGDCGDNIGIRSLDGRVAEIFFLLLLFFSHVLKIIHWRANNNCYYYWY